jgi:hypothetical protein|nr:MAG TPA: hypothetical protein [Crassvirales sp.]
MINDYQYINIRRILDELKKHPLLQDLTLEQVVSYTITFIGIFGMPKLYQDKEESIHIENFRVRLPCDLISINQIKECETGICLRSMTDTFMPREHHDRVTGYRLPQELSFKTQGQVLYVSFKTGDVLVSYKAIPIDKDGFPLLIDNPVFLKALEAYIKKEEFTILFDIGKITPAVLQNTQQQYAWLAGQLQSEFTIPSISEMESIKNSWCALIQKVSEFDSGFKSLGDKEKIRLQ